VSIIEPTTRVRGRNDRQLSWLYLQWQRVPHELSTGTLQAPPVIDAREAEKQLQKLASAVDARQKQLVAWGASGAASDAQIGAAASACVSELRDVRRSLDIEIERLGTQLKLINIALVPALIAIAAIVLAIVRRRKLRAGRAAAHTG